ncbi:transcription initiation factor IIF, beta subunit [Amanita rubescens]|nr:transcription initiation factor IIF, beta subunit [Amanita rubescens]
MNDVDDEEKKPFEAELGGNDEDSQPDPDEHLMLDQGNGRVWMVKIPRFLMERWSAIEADDVHLATIRVYTNDVNPHTKKPRIILFLPPGPSSSSTTPTATPEPMPSDQPTTYELEMVNDSVENQIVVAERPKDPSLSVSATSAALTTNTRARTTILTGRIKHECNLRPMFSASYRKQMRERHKKYNTPTRQIRMIEDAGVPGGRGGVNRLSSGVGVGAGGAFGDLIKTKPKPAKGAFERMARMPRNQLLDQIFSLFRDPARWGIKALREKTQQPEAYLKEVLSEVAFLHRSGEYNGLWELKDNFKGDADRIIESRSMSDVKMESVDEAEDEDEDEEDEDMEEVS